MKVKTAKKFLRFLALAALLILGPLLFAEGLIRFCRFVIGTNGDLARLWYFEDVNIQIYNLWLDETHGDPFIPPLFVYANKDWGNPERLRKIFETTRLPPSQTWTSYDFILPHRAPAASAYTIHSNSLGFRGPEHLARKPRGTIRIIALGSYGTFGHAVNDDQSYPAQLEARLNAIAGKHGRKFEVWNGGREAGSAIIGLARLKHEIFQYEPDLVILDYGMVDCLLIDDNFFPAANRFPDTPGYLALRRVLRPLVPVLYRSQLLQRLLERYLNSSKKSSQLGAFHDTMEKAVGLAKDHGVPVISMQQLINSCVDNKAYSVFRTGPVLYVDVGNIFEYHPPAPETWYSDEFRSGWTKALPSPAIHYSREFRYAPYRADLFQLNALGYNVIADSLADEVLKTLHIEANR